jgi:hypothetical protein
MKRISVVGLSIVALFAMSALLATSASAKEKPKKLLTMKTAKGPLAAGAALTASSSNLKFVTSAGNLECSSNIIEGEAKTNNATKDTGPIKGEKSTGSETVEGKSGACKTTTPLGATLISVNNLPWSDTFTDKGGNEVKGKKVSFTSTFAGGIVCIFEASKVKSSFTIGGPVKITTANQVFKASKASNGACPKEGKLSGEFSVTSGGETVESELT